MKQYNTTYKLWWSFCHKINISVFKAIPREVILFLQDLFDKYPHKYGTFNSHRSALSLILPNDIASDVTLKRFLKGASRLRPTRPKYDSTWDPKPLLNYLSGISTQNLKPLSIKLVTLLALLTGGRLQTISLIRASNIVMDEEKIQIFISDPIKTSGRFKTQPCLHIPFFKENPLLCAASTLLNYVETTKSFRDNQDFLFITTTKPYKKASKQTLSRWVKEALKAAGINTNQFQPHSTRHASNSAAFRLGVSLEVICRTAGWSERTATFAKHYNRPLTEKTDFAKAILRLAD